MPTPAQRLIWAIQHRRYARLRELLLRPGYLTSALPSGQTALHSAAEVGNLLAVQSLLEAGAAVNGADRKGQTPLHWAACCGQGTPRRGSALSGKFSRLGWRMPRPVVSVLLEILKAKNPNLPVRLGLRDKLSGVIKMDVLFGLLEMYQRPADLLSDALAHGMDLDLVAPFFADELRGNPRFVPVVKHLLDHGANPRAVDASGCTPLGYAVDWGTPDIVAALLERGAASREELEADMGLQLLERCLERGLLEMAHHLVRWGANPRRLPNALHNAAFTGRTATLEWLLRHGFELDQREDGITPLRCAARNGQHETVARLISLGADPQACDAEGDGLLHHSAGWPNCLKIALPLGLPLDRTNNDGRSPLHRASQYNETECIRLFLQAGANVNATDHNGNTALHLMFESDEFRPDIEFPSFLTLVEAGADLTLRNLENQTAYDLAVQWRYPEEYRQLLHPEGNGGRPGTFLWLGSDPSLRQLMPAADVPLTVDGRTYASSQAWFEARKAEILREGLCWGAHCDAAMIQALRQKFLQHPDLAKRLLATGDAVLIADNSAEGGWGGYWTERAGVPFNALGHFLAKLREELRLDILPEHGLTSAQDNLQCPTP